MESEHRNRNDIKTTRPSESENGGHDALHDSFKKNIEGDVVADPESISSPESSHAPQWSMVSASPDVFSMRSPMAVPPGYDPKRIPSSIFSTKAANQTDWSITSNESLFSINMGKSGELPRLDDYNHTHPYDRRSCELSGTLPTVMEVPAQEETSVNSSNVSPRHDKTESFQVGIDSHGGKKMGDSVNHQPSLSNARLSMDSGTSATSFAFPLLTNDELKTGSVRESTTKQEKEEAQEEQEHKEIAKTPARRWFGWLSCWPGRCC